MRWTKFGALVVVLGVGCGASRRSVGPLPSDSATTATGAGGAPQLAATGGAPGLGGAPVNDGGASALGGSPVGPAGGAPSEQTPGDDALALRAWRQRLAAANCVRDLDCMAFWPSEDDCVHWASTVPDYASFFGGVDEDSYVASTHTLAAVDVLDACIAAVTDAPCDDSRTPYEACLNVLVQKAPRGTGEPCAEYSPYVDVTRCGVGLVCTGSYPCLTCEPLPPAATEGETCSSDQDCAAGLACVRDVCRAYASLPGEGESCAEPGTCRDALDCSLYSELCVRPGAENEPCAPDEADTCLRDLKCVVDVATGDARCHPFAQRGEPCPRSRDAGAAACDDDTWCVFETSDAPSGTCGVPPFSAGPCSLFAQDSSYFCPVGTYADPMPTTSGALPDACTCKAELELGAPCHADVECRKGFCDGRDGDDTDDDDQRCVPLLADGVACTPETSEHCASLDGCTNGSCGADCE